jgi:hypothetical protein
MGAFRFRFLHRGRSRSPGHLFQENLNLLVGKGFQQPGGALEAAGPAIKAEGFSFLEIVASQLIIAAAAIEDLLSHPEQVYRSGCGGL